MARPNAARVRYNAEYFGFIVGMPDGEILLVGPEAMLVLHESTRRDELVPYLLPTLEILEPFHLATPVLVWLELTRRCDFACPHCYINGGSPRLDEMPSERWFSLLDEMSAMGVWGVAFTGGEPTLHPEFVNLVNHARERDLLVGIATHGMFLTDDILASMPTDGVIVSVSVDDLHVRRTRLDSSTDLAKRSIKRAQEHGFLTNIMTNTHRENVEKLPDLVEWAEDNGVSVRSVPFSPLGRGKLRLDLENTVEDVDTLARFWVRECRWEHQYHQKAGLCVGSIFNYGLTLAYLTRRCASGRYLGYVAADGTMFPCTMCAAEDVFRAGNVRNRHFAEVWREEWAIRDRSWADFADTCEGCEINTAEFYCAARCPAMSHARHGTFHECGASAFEIQSTIRRTAMLIDAGTVDGIPVVPPGQPS